MDWEHWGVELLKAACLWWLVLGAYYLCWVKYPPRENRRQGESSHGESEEEWAFREVLSRRWGSPRFK